MLLLEIASQGVRGLAPAGGRFTLKAGYNVVAADGLLLRRVLEALLHPDPGDAEAIPRAAAAPGGATPRAGLTLVGDDGITYRLLRDFGGGCQLHRFDPTRRAFALVAQDLPAVAAFLAAGPGVPPPDRLRGGLLLAAAEMPSRQLAAGLRGATVAPPVRRALSPEEAERKRAALRAELEKAKAAEAIQSRLDELQSQLFRLEEVSKGGEKIREGLSASEAALADLARAAESLDRVADLDRKLAAFEKAAAKRDESLARLEADRAAAEQAGRDPGPPWKDPQIVGGAAAGLVAVGLGLAGASTGQTGLRYLALLDVPAFGLSAWAALRWVSAREAFEQTGRRRRLAGDRERKVLEQYERDTAEVKGLMKALGVGALPDLREVVGRLADARAVAAEWRQRQESWEASPENRQAAAEKERAQAEIADLERRLADQAGGYQRDARSVEMELERLEVDLASPPPPAAPLVAPALSGPPVEPLRAALERGAASLGGTPAEVARAIQPRVGQILPAISGQRFSAVFWDERGNVSVQGGGRSLQAASLPPIDRDLLWLAVKVGVLEQALSRGRTFALLDDAFASLPDGARRALAGLLKQIARSGQIVHATQDPVCRQAADHQAA
ncbi:MAG TPA: hypothetical protein VFR85_14990 [Anaeromyxobacteraceae bacterium]|nr:hypothetical protein [Anaeromyxobacteraceae bacterium]